MVSPSVSTPERPAYRAIWISDVHLGTRWTQSELLLDFLRLHDAEYLYLVGDIVDGWQLQKNWYWPQAQNDVVQKLLRKVRKGTKVFYIPGNHDEFLRGYISHISHETTQLTTPSPSFPTDAHHALLTFGGITLVREAIHTTADGRKLLVMHGDEFDGITQYAKWLAHLGDWAYNTALHLNQFFNMMRRKLGYPPWSLAGYLKHKVKNAVQFIGAYEKTVAEYARSRNVDGVVCGHIHHAEIRWFDNILYCNDGDWVESYTALVESWDGALSIIKRREDEWVKWLSLVKSESGEWMLSKADLN